MIDSTQGTETLIPSNHPPQEELQSNGAAWTAELTIHSVLGHLPLHHFQVHYSVPGQQVLEQLLQMPACPGVLITAGGRPIGLVARPKLLEYLYAHPQATELLNRPIEALLQAMSEMETGVGGFLELPDTCPVQTGAIAAIHRHGSLVFDPIIVTFRDHSVRLLNFHDLLLAQSRVVGLFNQINLQQRQQLLNAYQKLQQDQTRTEQTRQFLLAQQRLIHHQENLSEQQQIKLLQQIEQIHQLKKRQQQIEQDLSQEAIKTVQTALETAQFLSKRTQQIAMISQMLNKELDIVQRASQLTKQIGKQVQFLGLRSAILANRSGVEREGFSQITADIRHLSSQTLEAAQGMEEIMNWLKSCMVDLENIVQGGTDVAKASAQQALRLREKLQEWGPLPTEEWREEEL